MSISSFIQAKSRGAPLAALPIFLKRGVPQRSLFCSTDSSLNSPEQLAGKKVGLVGYTSSMAVWMRGVLNEAYGLDPSSVRWFSLSGSFPGARLLRIPDQFSAEKISAWEEVDGYAHDLDRREAFLLSLLDRGELDAVVSFQARIEYEGIRPVLDEDSLWSHPLNCQVYPINHLFVVKTHVVHEFPTMAASLLSAFGEARSLWTAYQPDGERGPMEREMAKLGHDPFAYRLGEMEKKTLETFVGYLERETLINRRLEVDELIYSGG